VRSRVNRPLDGTDDGRQIFRQGLAEVVAGGTGWTTVARGAAAGRGRGMQRWPSTFPSSSGPRISLLLRKFIFDFWAKTGRAPNLRQMHEGTDLTRRSIIQALKLLQTGIVVVVDQDSPNCDILKAPPYSAFPSQVEMYIDDKFHSFIGCAHEAVAVSNMPDFKGIEVRLESYLRMLSRTHHLVVKLVRNPAHGAGRPARAHRHADVGLGAR